MHRESPSVVICQWNGAAPLDLKHPAPRASSSAHENRRTGSQEPTPIWSHCANSNASRRLLRLIATFVDLIAQRLGNRSNFSTRRQQPIGSNSGEQCHVLDLPCISTVVSSTHTLLTESSACALHKSVAGLPVRGTFSCHSRSNSYPLADEFTIALAYQERLQLGLLLSGEASLDLIKSRPPARRYALARRESSVINIIV
jgi:hypothetical protein